MTFEARDAQLTASFSKSRSTLTIQEVIDEDCPEPPNPESIHQPILVDLKREESVSTPPNPPSSQANPIPSHATPSEQLPQPGDNTAQPQNNPPLLKSYGRVHKPTSSISLLKQIVMPFTPEHLNSVLLLNKEELLN
ncbi:hypothetical protein C0995_001772 [Termitomyces sp. Mi166|nr:hypothetical protein C0995_001772 [Termitomyces sp. Mi166\